MTRLSLPAADGPSLMARAVANETAKGLRLLWQRKVMLVAGIIANALIYLALQFLIGDGHIIHALLAETLPALLAFAIAGTMALSGSGGIAEEINGGTLEQACISPVPPALLVVGRLAALLTEGLITAVVLGTGFVLAYGPHYVMHPDALVPALLVTVDVLGYGLLITGLTISVAGVGAVTHVFNMAIMFFGGMFFPVTVFPHGVEIVARLVPTTLGVQVLNAVLAGRSLPATWSNGTLPLLLAHCAVLITAGWVVYLHALRRGKRDGRLTAR